MVLRVDCNQGLGNRVAAIANGLSRAERVTFPWVLNEHCPVQWWEVFPEGIEGVEFTADAPGPTTKWIGIGCERWDAAGDRAAADAAYGRIMAAMAGEPGAGCTVALAGRFFRTPGADAERLALFAAVGALLGGPVFVFADSRRAEIRRVLDGLGVRVAMPRSSELGEDLARDRAGMLAYLSDWQRLLTARVIVAIDGPSSALHPARAAGIEIIYVPAGRLQGACSAAA